MGAESGLSHAVVWLRCCATRESLRVPVEATMIELWGMFGCCGQRCGGEHAFRNLQLPAVRFRVRYVRNDCNFTITIGEVGTLVGCRSPSQGATPPTHVLEYYFVNAHFMLGRARRLARRAVQLARSDIADAGVWANLWAACARAASDRCCGLTLPAREARPRGVVSAQIELFR